MSPRKFAEGAEDHNLNQSTKECKEDWAKRWRSCIALNEAYFEGNKIRF